MTAGSCHAFGASTCRRCGFVRAGGSATAVGTHDKITSNCSCRSAVVVVGVEMYLCRMASIYPNQRVDRSGCAIGTFDLRNSIPISVGTALIVIEEYILT